MHPSIVEQQARERIAQFHREADHARLAKMAKARARGDRRIGSFQLRVFRRALAGVGLSVMFVLGGSAAMAFPTDAGTQRGDLGGKRSATEICLPKRVPDGLTCTRAGTGATSSVIRDAESPSETSSAASGIELDVQSIAVVTTVALLGAGAAMALRRRVAPA